MTKDEAYNIVEQVVVNYKGTRQEHALLQQAMDILKTKQDKDE